MKTRAKLMCGIVAIAATCPAHAQDAATLAARGLVANCANCHGTDGRTAPGAPMRSLAGMPREELLAQMKAFRDGTRPSTIMGQLSKGFSDAQLAQMAAWLAAQK